MYTHCRQFPHFVHMSDDDIRASVRESLLKRPKYLRLMKYRNIAILTALVLAVVLPVLVAQAKLGLFLTALGRSLVITGAVSTAVILCWNVVWVNKVLFRITQEDATGSSAQPEDSPDAAAPQPPPLNVDDDDERAPDE